MQCWTPECENLKRGAKRAGIVMWPRFRRTVQVPRTIDAVTLFPLNLIPQFWDVCLFSYVTTVGTHWWGSRHLLNHLVFARSNFALGPGHFPSWILTCFTKFPQLRSIRSLDRMFSYGCNMDCWKYGNRVFSEVSQTILGCSCILTTLSKSRPTTTWKQDNCSQMSESEPCFLGLMYH